MEFSVEEIAAATGGKRLIPAAPGLRAEAITWDSREVAPKTLFVALPGAKTDGHDYIVSALAQGASAVLMSRDATDRERTDARNAGAALIQVDDGAKAIADLARRWRERLRARVIGITGSSGKTTTKNLTTAALSARWRVSATAGNQNNELGVPKTILDTPLDAQLLVIELGVDAPGDMAWLVDLVRPDWGVIVSIGASHLEFLKDERTVAWEKSGLWRALPATGRAFVNGDDDWAAECCRFGNLDRSITFDLFGTMPKADALSAIGATRATTLAPAAATVGRRELRALAERQVYADRLTCDRWGRPRFDLVVEGPGATGVFPVTLQLVGAHTAVDACAAAAVALACDVPIEAILAALEGCEPEPGRAQVRETEGGWVLFDDSYNANPLSMAAALRSFAQTDVEGARYAILGDMGELGERGPEAHRAVGELVADLGLDGAVFVGPLSALAAESARSVAGEALALWEVETAADAAAALADVVRAGDAVLVKGSRFMGLEAAAEELA